MQNIIKRENMRDWKNENHCSRPLKSAKLVEYKCICQKGFYRVDDTRTGIKEHNQIPHKCHHCGHTVFFSHPYPVIEVNGQRFVHWETIRGVNFQEK